MTTWQLDTSHTSIGFSVRHLMFAKVRGRFTRYTVDATLGAKGIEDGAVKVTIEAASIDTTEAKRDAHLRSADFFDVENHPTLTFESRAVQKLSDTEYKITGALTIRGVTREVELEVEALGTAKDPWGGEHHGFTAKTHIDRKEFGLTWNQALEAGGVLVSDRVDISVELQLVRQALAA